MGSLSGVCLLRESTRCPTFPGPMGSFKGPERPDDVPTPGPVWCKTRLFRPIGRVFLCHTRRSVPTDTTPVS